IQEKKDLVAYFEKGCTPLNQRKIGTEHELFVYKEDSLQRAPHTDDTSGNIFSLLQGMQSFGWAPVQEVGHLIALRKGKASVTLEPGGQVELSGSPLKTLHETHQETEEYQQDLKTVCKNLQLLLVPLGSESKWDRDQRPWMPKARYRLMREYMPKKGNHGVDMMQATTTAQVNLDYVSEKDMVIKFRPALKLQPLTTALFANSPFDPGKMTSYQSRRSFYWTHTDPDRCGLISQVFEDSFSFEAYTDFALDVPMYFVYRGDDYLDARGQSFRDFLTGNLAAYPGQLPTFKDWADHLTTIFTEVRLKTFLEMRGADGGDQRHILALSAFWTGLLYDETALNFCEDLTKNWTFEDVHTLLIECAKDGFNASIKGQSVRDLAQQLVCQAQKALQKRACLNEKGQDESIYLDYLIERLEKGTRSTLWKKAFQGPLNQDVDALLRAVSKTL
ncbi:MAG: glutamate--cysteine ligase, partial [bacterium]|nr:glutamate--cysteine ligase [bacterium]